MCVLTRWDQELPPDLSSDIFLNLALWEVAAIVDDTIREFFSAALLRGDLNAVIDFVVDYSRLSCEDSRHVRQIQAYYAKRSDLDLGYDKQGVAQRKFLDSEELCSSTNEIFKSRAFGKFQFFPRVERVLWHASRKIGSILGDVPDLRDLRFRFGPGATTQIPKRNASARAKLGVTPACSSELSPAADFVLQMMPGWRDLLFGEGPHRPGATPVPIHTGKIAFVPKSAKEFRTIMVEPSLNTMCQAGIGSFMAERLRRCGVDIKDQTRNQSLARRGSLDGSLATVDLSSASDTVAIELVYDLLGIDWFSFLSRFRTGTATLNGVAMKLEKFSSMGNGFTFPLETLIFYALAWGCVVESGVSAVDVNAYGDDIIVPTSVYPLLLEVFAACGFVVNTKKSYASGPFRESCGVDYFQGIDIRPVYSKVKPSESSYYAGLELDPLEAGPRTCDLFRIHNFFYRNCDSSVCEYLASFLDPTIRLYGPDGYGDGHLLGKWDGYRKRRHGERGFGGYLFDTFTFKPRRSFWASRGDWVLPAYSIYLSEGEVDRSLLRGSGVTWDTRSASFSVSLPGVSGINRISIYTFSSS